MATRVDVDEAIRLVAGGAPVIDVLPQKIYDQEHLPGAMNVPLETFRPDDVAAYDRDQPIVVYCFDQHCDLSARAARRLEAEGFTRVFDLIGGRASWTALGLATEGTVGDRRRIAHFVEPATSVALGSTIGDVRDLDPRYPVAVVTAEGILLGALEEPAGDLPGDTPVARAMVPAPGTIRSEMRVEQVVDQLGKDRLSHVFVTTVSGALFGLVRTDELHV
jgi:rhodanese-related sulfurtransferase